MRNIQYPQTKHAHHENLSAPRQIQAIELLDRKSHDHDIEDHVDRSCAPSLCIDIVALVVTRFVPAIPRALYRATLED
jgi:hypothetical protein